MYGVIMGTVCKYCRNIRKYANIVKWGTLRNMWKNVRNWKCGNMGIFFTLLGVGKVRRAYLNGCSWKEKEMVGIKMCIEQCINKGKKREIEYSWK